MIKKLLLTALAACVGSLSGNAIIWHYGNFNASKKTCAVTSWSGSQPTSGKLSVPETYKHTDGVTYSVNTIASHALDNLTEVTEISIHAGIVNIGTAIKEQYVNLNGDAENFFNCPQLKKFTVSADNPMFKSSAGGTLYYKTSTAVLRVPQKMAVSGGVFKMPDDCTHVAPNAFSENTTTTKIRIPGFCTVGYNGGFNRCVNLAEFEILDSPTLLKIIGGALVSDNLETLISVPPASAITSVSLPKTVKIIGQEACYNCKALKSLKMTGVEEINKWAFKGSGIETLDFPATISTFDTESVAGATSLQSINFNASGIRLMVGFARDCTALETVTSKYPLDELEDCVFKNCTSLKNFPFNGATELEGDSLFYNCGFEKVIFEPGLNNEEWTGQYTFCNNRWLTEIDASAIEGTGESFFVISSPFANNCMKLATLKLPPYTGFTRYSSDNYTALNIPAFENTQLMHIETGCFWIGENDYKFVYSPINGQTDIRPKVYVATTRCSDSSNSFYNTWPLKYMCMGNNGAVVTPDFYCDALTPSEDYVAARGKYHVPGGCLKYYNEASQQGRDVEEMFGFDIQRLGTNMRITALPYSGITDMTISFNGGEPQTLPVNQVYYPELRYADINHILLSYKKDGVQMSTAYPSIHWLNTNIADIAETPTTTYTVYDLNGLEVLTSSDKADLDLLPSGLYIINEGGAISKYIK